VVKREAPEAKYNAAAAISSGSPGRPSGTQAIICPNPAICSGVSSILPAMGVLMGPA
jgi:hypothetical protein